MVSVDQARQLLDAQIVDADGESVGTVSDVYLNDQTAEISWVAVTTGWFGHGESLLPLDRAQISRDQIRVPFGKPTIRNAPRYQSGVPLSPQDEEELYRYYGFQADTAADRVTNHRANSPEYRAGRRADDSEDTSTRDGVPIGSEDRLDSTTEPVSTDRPRLRKYVRTEMQTVTVPVSHEVARLEREPIDDVDGDRASSVELTEDEIEIVLHAERPVVITETVPVERVRLDTPTVTPGQRFGAGSGRINPNVGTPRPGRDGNDRSTPETQ